MFEKQSPTFDVTFVFMLFCIIYAERAALTFGNNKTSRHYCLEICKEIAVLYVNLEKYIYYGKFDFLYQYLNDYHNFFVTHFPEVIFSSQIKILKLFHYLLRNSCSKFDVDVSITRYSACP